MLPDRDKEAEVRRNQLLDRHIGSRVRARRAACGITPEAMCRVLSISEEDLMRWEEGKARPVGLMLLEVANLLSVEVAYFVEGLRDLDGKTVSNPL